ncbi:MAG: ribonuclease III [Maricaulaceae bacterium]
MADNQQKLKDLEGRIGYEFKDKDLFIEAMTHPSFGDGRGDIRHFERLEFLGDRILNLMTAKALYDREDLDQGHMARKLNALVRKEACADVARQINLGEALLLSAAEDKNGGRDKTSILGDACEALIAALYLDGGLDVTQAFYDRYWSQMLSGTLNRSLKDPKTALQEYSVLRGFGMPKYSIIKRDGPDHNPSFHILASVSDEFSSLGIGGSKKDAERNAAKLLLSELLNNKNKIA